MLSYLILMREDEWASDLDDGHAFKIMSNSFLLGELVSEQLVEGVIWAASVISPQLISTWHYSGILSVQSDLAYLQKKKDEEKVRHCGQFYLVSCSILLGWRILICCHLLYGFCTNRHWRSWRPRHRRAQLEARVSRKVERNEPGHLLCVVLHYMRL